MKINYCLPIIKKNQDEILQMIEENKSDYQYFEIWLDYLDNLDEAFLTRVSTLLQDRLIVLFRRQNLEPITMPLQRRLDTLALLSRFTSMVDLDISQKEELAYIAKIASKPQLILSYHNYQETPSYKAIDEVIKEMEPYHPRIYKIATECQNEDDAFRLMQVLRYLKKQNKKHIVLGMGKFGTITRVFGTLWGNEMIFAPKTLEEQSAEGQLTKADLEKIFAILN